jgi:SAM-dependent methyltransferase
VGAFSSLTRLFGLDLRRTAASLGALPKYLGDYRALRRQLAAAPADFPFRKPYPVLGEHQVQSGVASGHYFHQDLSVARRIYQAKPARHIDVGSRVDGFVAHVAVFREIEVADIRRLSTTAANIRFVQCDLMDEAATDRLGTADSVSCLHTLEHFGLGRYGDPIAADGHQRGLRNLCRLVAPGGTLYVSVPVGPQRIEFNAHRVFAATTLPALVPPGFELRRFSLVDDSGDFREDIPLSTADAARSFGCQFGCGIYEFVRAA